MWIWVCVAIIVVGAAVHAALGWSVWQALKGLFAQGRALGKTAENLERELSRIGTPAVTAGSRPRHGMDVAPRA